MKNQNFTGSIYQCIESLEYGDACSTHVLNLDRLLKQAGYNSHIYCEYLNSEVTDKARHLSAMKPTDADIVICHYSGFSANIIPYLTEIRCTKIILYHNITPHEFFAEGSEQHGYCLKGRQQLPSLIGAFHYYWGVSAYNLEELISLGADPAKCSVVPLVVSFPEQPGVDLETERREPGSWLFVGRIAPNKGHLALLDAFHQVRKREPAAATKLYLVGNPQSDALYYKQVSQRIAELGLSSSVIVTGKISDDAVRSHFRRAGVYVAMSRHEGFGAPLIEASYFDLPVVALSNTGTAETLAGTGGLAGSVEEAAELARKITTSSEFSATILRQQKTNALRFTKEKVSHQLATALARVIPSPYRFQKVSIVICTKNRGPLLDRALHYLQYQTHPNFEVIVVDSESTDTTPEVLRQFSGRIKTARNPVANLSVSRNLGIELARGDLVTFIDDDAIAFDDFVETVLAEFNRRPLTTAGLGGPVYFRGTLKFQCEDIGFSQFAEAKENIAPEEIGAGIWERSLLGTNATYRTDLLRETGGFDEQFDYFLDESELSFRLQRQNFLVAYCPHLYVRHEFAQGDNRQSKFKFNWHSICKNTAYFISAYSGLSGKELTAYVNQKILAERGGNLKKGLDHSELSQADYTRMMGEIQKGIDQGLQDAKSFPRTRKLTAKDVTFCPFDRNTPFPTVHGGVKRLHVCILTKELQPFTPAGGNGTQFYHLASELLLMGHEVTVVLPDDFRHTYRQGRFVIEYIPISDLAGESTSFTVNVNWSLSALAAIAKIHQTQPIDVIESTLWDSEALAFALLPREERPPFVVRLVTPYSVAAKINGWKPSSSEMDCFNAAEKAVIAQADAVIPISDCIAETISEIHSVARDARWEKSYCGIASWPSFDPWENYNDLTHINGTAVKFSRDSKLVLFVGRLEYRKGIDLLLAAANAILQSDPEAHLIFAGKDEEGFAGRAGKYIAERLLDRAHFLGAVDNTTRDKLFHAAHCLVFPSRYESFGFVPVEAFVHGCPVVAMRTGAIPEVVAEDKCGLLFEKDDAEGLARQVIRLLKEPGLRERLVQGARKQSSLFSSRRMAIDAVKIYSALVNPSPYANPVQHAEAKTSGHTLAKTVIFNGSSPRLQTECGTREGKQIKTAGKPGHLVFGPYVDLKAGSYLVQLQGQIGAAGEPAAYAEVVINSGNNVLRKSSLAGAPTNLQTTLVEMPVEFASPSQVEVRVWVPGNATITITKLVITETLSAADRTA